MKLLNFGLAARRLGKRIGEFRTDLYRVALSWCGDSMLADDLAQEALARAIAKQHQLRDEAKLEYWLFRIMSNCWKEHLRQRHPSLDIDELVFTSDHTPEIGLRKQQITDRVQAAISHLPLGQRQVVTLVDLKGFSYVEVAEVLELPVGTVMSRLSRARVALKAQLLSLEGELNPERCHLRRVK